MRKFYLFLSFLAVVMLSVCSYAQEVVTLTFEAERQDHSYQKLDSIKVTNLTKGWSEVLYYPDTMLVVNTVGIPNWESEKGNVRLYQNVPNPFNGITDFKMTLLGKEKVELVIFDINGKKVAEYRNTLQGGEHYFRATMNTPQTYLLSAVTKNGNTSIKMINLSNTGERACIEHISSAPLLVGSARKQSENPFSKGDNMEYVGYATQFSGSQIATVTQKQQGSGIVTFVFPNEDIPAYLKVTTDSAFNINSSSATLSGSWKAHKMTVLEEGFNWKKAGASEWNVLICDHQEPEFIFGLRNLEQTTEYVFRAFAVSDDNEYYYGDEVAFFTTQVIPPTITTDSVTDIAFNSAKVFGSYTKGEESVKKIGFELRQGEQWVNVRSFIGAQIKSPFSCEVFDLKPAFKYEVRAYAITESDTTYAKSKYFTTKEVQQPLVKTLEANYVNYSSASLYGEYVKTDEDIIAVGFKYKAASAEEWQIVKAALEPSFNYKLSALTPNTKYVYKAFVSTASFDEILGEEMTFTTTEFNLPTIVTGEATDVDRKSAVVGGVITQGENVEEYGVIYNLFPKMTFEYNVVTPSLFVGVKSLKPQAGKELGEFTVKLDNLVQGTIYYVRAYARVGEKYFYGDDVKMVTKDPEGLIDCGVIKDVQGNEYRTVKFGAACWTRDNVRATVLRDGTPLKPVTSGNMLSSTELEYFDMDKHLVKGAYGEPIDMSVLPVAAGHLYNKAVALRNEICPAGWGIPTEEDWCNLFEYLAATYSLSSPTCENVTTPQKGNAVILASPYFWRHSVLSSATNQAGFNYYYVGDYDRSYWRANNYYTGLYVSNQNEQNPEYGPRYYQFVANADGLAKYTSKNEYGYHLRCVKDPNPTAPTVVTEEMTDVSYYTATANGNVTSHGYSTILKRGFCWNTKGNPSLKDSVSHVEGSQGRYSFKMTNLKPQTTYYIKAYVINMIDTAYGKEISFTTLPEPLLPKVVVSTPQDILVSTATVNAEVLSDGGAEVTERGVCYSTEANPTIESSLVKVGKGVGSYTVNLTGLERNTRYYVRAYAVNIMGVAYSSETVLTTLAEPVKPSVTTVDIMSIMDTRATVCARVNHDGGAKLIERGVCYSKSNEKPDLKDAVVKATSAEVGTYNVLLNSLEMETRYFARAYATNSAGTTYGEPLSFTTRPEIKDMRVEAGEVTDITPTSATVSAVQLNGVGVLGRGFLYSLYPGRNLLSHSSMQLIDVLSVSGVEDGEFTVSLNELVHGAIYYVRAYVKTADTILYSEDMKVVMPDPEGMVDCGTAVDADGNSYRTVALGKLCWTRENLRTTKLSDGTPINAFVVDKTEALPMTDTYYVPVVMDADTLPKEVVGYFYNYGTALSKVTPCPEGWRVATFDDYMNLFKHIQETYNISGTLNVNPARGSVGLSVAPTMVLPYYSKYSPFTVGTNVTGFNYFYAGDMDWNIQGFSYYRFPGRYDALLTSTPSTANSDCPWFIQSTGNTSWQKYYNDKASYGQYIRCAKDKE